LREILLRIGLFGDLMKTLLINKLGDYEPYKKKQGTIQYPLGLAFIYNAIKKANLSVEVLDLNTNPLTKDELKKLSSKYDILAFSTSIGNSLDYILNYIELLKSDSNYIVVGGVLATSETERFMNETKADIIVIGEGEKTIVELIKCLNTNKDLSKVKGICYREGNKIKKTEYSGEMDVEQCEADYNAFDVSSYITEEKINLGKKNISMFTSRGCPYDCQFCSHPFGKRWRGISANKIIKQIKHLKEKYGIDGIVFCDDNFMHDKKRLEDFLDLLEKEKLNIEWTCSARVNNVVDVELVKRMKKLGCKWIGLGAESGSQKTLNNMHKGITVRQIYNCLNILEKANMFYYVYLMFGMPNESFKDAFQTLKLINRVRKTDNIALIGLFNPRPNSMWYKSAIKQGLKPLTLREWAKYSKKDRQLINMSDMNHSVLSTVYCFAYLLTLMNKHGLNRIKKHLHPKKVLKIIKNKKIF